MGGIYTPALCRDMFYYLTKGTWRYVIYKFADQECKEVTLDRCGRRDATFADFKKAMPENEARWAIFDFEKTVKEKPDGKNKLAFITYNPESNSNKDSRKAINFKRSYFKANILVKTGFDMAIEEVAIRSHEELNGKQIYETISSKRASMTSKDGGK